MAYQKAMPSTPAEVQEKAEHEEDETACDWPYPEHDESSGEWVDGIWSGECRRCGAALRDQ